MPSSVPFVAAECASIARHEHASAALEAAAASIFGLLSRTLEAGARELQVVSAQEEITAPSRRFIAEAC